MSKDYERDFAKGYARDCIEPPKDASFEEALTRACKEDTLIKALSWIALWESERVVKQAKTFYETGTRTGSNGGGWDTCFEYCFNAVNEQYIVPTEWDSHDIEPGGYDIAWDRRKCPRCLETVSSSRHSDNGPDPLRSPGTYRRGPVGKCYGMKGRLLKVEAELRKIADAHNTRDWVIRLDHWYLRPNEDSGSHWGFKANARCMTKNEADIIFAEYKKKVTVETLRLEQLPPYSPFERGDPRNTFLSPEDIKKLGIILTNEDTKGQDNE